MSKKTLFAIIVGGAMAGVVTSVVLNVLGVDSGSAWSIGVAGGVAGAVAGVIGASQASKKR